jgi:hypothetical protein
MSLRTKSNRSARPREADFDFLQAGLQQQFEEAQLALGVHRFDQGLVAIAQVGAHPDRRRVDDLAGPGAVGQVDGGKGGIGGGVVNIMMDLLVSGWRGMRVHSVQLLECFSASDVADRVAWLPRARGQATLHRARGISAARGAAGCRALVADVRSSNA